MGGEEKLQRQKDNKRLNVRERIKLLLDKNSFHEIGKIAGKAKYDENGSPVMAGLNRLSKPGRRLYVGSDSLPRNNGGLGTVVVSTSRGLLPDSEARKRKLGGELICEVWS